MSASELSTALSATKTAIALAMGTLYGPVAKNFAEAFLGQPVLLAQIAKMGEKNDQCNLKPEDWASLIKVTTDIGLGVAIIGGATIAGPISILWTLTGIGLMAYSNRDNISQILSNLNILQHGGDGGVKTGGPTEPPCHSNPATNTNFRDAVTFTPRDPLALDLDNDGIETVAINPTAPILFDHNGDGAPSATGWLKGDDGWLVNDLDQDGKITSGKELLGVDTDITVCGVTGKATTGFEALRALDTHQIGDGKNLFDSRDAAFSQLRIWQDKNQNGVTDVGELSTLSALGIVSIQLQETATNVNLGGGNSITGKALVTRRVGTSTSTSEVDSVLVTNDSAANLADNPFYTDLPDVAVTDTARALPNMQGSGLVHSLREAMSLGTAAANTLTATVQAFAAATTGDAFGDNSAAVSPRKRGVFSDDFAVV